jgi:histidyl-tRNA synthetase
MAERLRAAGLWVELGAEGASLKSQLRRADRFGAGSVLIIGEDELKKGRAGWKDMKDGSSGEVDLEGVFELFSKGKGRG